MDKPPEDNQSWFLKVPSSSLANFQKTLEERKHKPKLPLYSKNMNILSITIVADGDRISWSHPSKATLSRDADGTGISVKSEKGLSVHVQFGEEYKITSPDNDSIVNISSGVKKMAIILKHEGQAKELMMDLGACPPSVALLPALSSLPSLPRLGNPSTWGVDQVVEFLQGLPEYAKYSNRFRAEDMTGPALLDVDVDLMVKVFGMKLEQARKLREKIDALQVVRNHF